MRARLLMTLQWHPQFGDAPVVMASRIESIVVDLEREAGRCASNQKTEYDELPPRAPTRVSLL